MLPSTASSAPSLAVGAAAGSGGVVLDMQVVNQQLAARAANERLFAQAAANQAAAASGGGAAASPAGGCSCPCHQAAAGAGGGGAASPTDNARTGAGHGHSHGHSHGGHGHATPLATSSPADVAVSNQLLSTPATEVGAAGAPEAPLEGASEEQMRAFVRWAARSFGANEDVMEKIAELESSWKPLVVNDWDSNARKGIPSKGLMQFIEPTFDSYAADAREARPELFEPYGDHNWMDWRQQALAAAWAVNAGHGSAWATYKRAKSHAESVGSL